MAIGERIFKKLKKESTSQKYAIQNEPTLNYIAMQSESGKFYCDNTYFAQKFEPAEDNIILENTYRHFIVPEGIVGFCSDFGAGITVTERFVLPQSLREIGKFDGCNFLDGCNNVFASSTLPTVIIPDTVETFGLFAFGSSRIDTLCLPAGFRTKTYARHFKDALIRKIYLHVDDYDYDDTCYNGFHWDCAYKEVYTYISRSNGCLPTESVLTPASNCRAWIADW